MRTMRRGNRRWGGMMGWGAFLLSLAMIGLPAGSAAQQQRVLRPIPAPVVPPPFYRAAVAEGSRSADGSPGAGYWRSHASYDIRAELDPETARIVGSETIRYRNGSPDTLAVLVLHLYLDLHRAGGMRNEPEEITGGVTLRRLVVDGMEASEGRLDRPGRFTTQATLLVVRPPRPLVPGATATLEIDWEETFPQNSSGRVGHSDHEVYFVGYWFPKMAVYDDLRGWDAEPYLGNAEFYDEFGDYRVSLPVPGGWSVMGTGALQNPEEVWSEQTRRRLAAAATADTIVHVATRADREAGHVTASRDGRLTYRFVADTVRDFAWTTSNVQLWDATSARVPGRSRLDRGERVLIQSFWRQDRAPLWEDQALYGKHAIEHHSSYTDFPYPWPHMTSVEGDDIIGGGWSFRCLR